MNPRIKRRHFLQNTSGLVGLLSLSEASSAWPADGAEAKDPNLPKSLAALEKLIAGMESDSPPYLCVPRRDGRFLNLLVRVVRARRVLELGTAHGYFALWMALGLEETEGRLTTIEILEERLKAARQHAAQAGLTRRLTFQAGDGHKLLAGLEGPFDLVFLNADKAGLVDYFQQLYPKKLAPGALLVSYGVLQAKEKMKPYLDLIGSEADFDTVTLSATQDDGFALSLRRRAAGPVDGPK
jgi:predicted O-methyltransferase YrrM